MSLRHLVKSHLADSPILGIIDMLWDQSQKSEEAISGFWQFRRAFSVIMHTQSRKKYLAKVLYYVHYQYLVV